ncbi:PREDICTED: uncharacterized protein LOC109152242 [Ipomoea nil]|uniref:uncharacterized protein LOC109152242 n=1 Tax=Ipomoea nil TaxID=35883 RepID=UPI000901D4CE|nr:PREDICTED: uncharacterized protein LOC109152242 [Ipomoea nil]
MPFSGAFLVSVATVSAEIWQRVACLPEHIPGEQLLDLVLCFPARELGRMAMHLWDFLCFSPTPYYGNTYYYAYTSSDDDDGDYGRPYAGLEYYDDSDSDSSSSG